MYNKKKSFKCSYALNMTKCPYLHDDVAEEPGTEETVDALLIGEGLGGIRVQADEQTYPPPMSGRRQP